MKKCDGLTNHSSGYSTSPNMSIGAYLTLAAAAVLIFSTMQSVVDSGVSSEGRGDQATGNRGQSLQSMTPIGEQSVGFDRSSLLLDPVG